MNESKKDDSSFNFDRKLKLEFHGVKVTSNAGLLAYREIDDVFGLTDMTTYKLTDNRTGKNTQHSILLPIENFRIFNSKALISDK